MSFEAIVFYIILLDAVCANIMVYGSPRWYTKHFRTLSRVFPAAKGWALYYLVLVVWIGSLMYRAGMIL